MQPANKIIDFQEHLFNKDIDSRIKSSRDDTLKIIQADIRVLDSKVDKNFELLDSKIDNNFEVLNAKIDSLAEVMKSDNKRLDDKIDKGFEVLIAKIDGAVSMRKWVVGILITILPAIARVS